MEHATIFRHKTAIRRGDFSRRVECMLRDGLVGKGVTFFDSGCGRGEDIGLENGPQLFSETRPAEWCKRDRRFGAHGVADPQAVWQVSAHPERERA